MLDSLGFVSSASVLPAAEINSCQYARYSSRCRRVGVFLVSNLVTQEEPELWACYFIMVMHDTGLLRTTRHATWTVKETQPKESRSWNLIK
jgi:hypothetical protein